MTYNYYMGGIFQYLAEIRNVKKKASFLLENFFWYTNQKQLLSLVCATYYFGEG